MNIKIIIDDGIVRAILKDSNTPIHVEIIDTSDSYSDDAIEKHAQTFLQDSNYISCDYSIADFTEYIK